MTTNNAINNFSPNKNLIIGGDFDTNPWQRQITFVSPINGTYTADMFCWLKAGAGEVTIAKAPDAPTVSQAGMVVSNSYIVATTTDDGSLAASDIYASEYRMEGFDWKQIAQLPFALSFWVKSFKPGVFCVSFSNSGQDRSYVAEFTINSASAWEKKIIIVSASPVAGTWNYGNAIGLRIRWCIAAGADFQTTAGTWQTGNFFSTANQVNGMDSVNNVFQLALIKCEGGVTVTSFEKEKTEDIFSQSLRYFYKTYNRTTFPGTSVTTGAMFGFAAAADTNLTAVMSRNKVNQRTTPTVSWYSTTGAVGNVRNLTAGADEGVANTVGAGDTSAGYPNLSGAATVDNRYGTHYTSDASL